MNSQMLMIFVGIATVAGVVTRDSAAQSPGSFTAEPTELEFGVKVEADDFPARPVSVVNTLDRTRHSQRETRGSEGITHATCKGR